MKNSRRHASILAACLLGALLFGPAAANAACDGSNEVFSDDFQDDAGGWALNRAVKIADGTFTFDLQPDEMQANLNVSHTIDQDVKICADAVWPEEEPGILGAGILFWGEDAKNYFQFGVLNTGKYWIARKENDRWQVIVQNVTSDAIKTGKGETNTLRIEANGDQVGFYVNGEKLRELRGQQPKGGWRFGLSGDNFDRQSAEAITFSSVTVTN
ncbi:hypothetical protein [Methyloligella halotolerans]|uniref:hypothetical protein n=1 Tax=Methyloligella halotolerans TaxID=1177755 RepID=UPI00114CA84C|nr:hypothetical protein [Methyloligella halotolerans]